MKAQLPWSPCGLVSWTTDFGLQNGFVGTMKGIVLGRMPTAQWVDLTHGIPAQSIEVAALELRSALPFFPAGSLHVVVVDPGVGTERKILTGRFRDQLILAPDNGLLPATVPGVDSLREVDWKPWVSGPISHTFHGRDVFAPVAAALLRKELDPSTGRPINDPVHLALEGPHPLGTVRFRLRIVMVDRFGNLICNWRPDRDGVLSTDASVLAGGLHLPILTTYGDATHGDRIALVNSFGYLEIAERNGHAAQALGLTTGDTVELHNPPVTPQ